MKRMAYIYLDTMLGLRDMTLSKADGGSIMDHRDHVGGRLPNYSSKY